MQKRRHACVVACDACACMASHIQTARSQLIFSPHICRHAHHTHTHETLTNQTHRAQCSLPHSKVYGISIVYSMLRIHTRAANDENIVNSSITIETNARTLVFCVCARARERINFKCSYIEM